MAGYTFASPVTPRNSKRKHFNSNSTRRTSSLFPHESIMNRNTPLKGSSSKVVKTKSRLKGTWKTAERAMYFSKYNIKTQTNQQPNKLSQHAINRGSMFYSKESTGYLDQRPFAIMDLVKANGLTALSPFKVARTPILTPLTNGFVHHQEEQKINPDLCSYKSKVEQIQESWKLPKESNVFKKSIESFKSTKPNLSIYPTVEEVVVNNHRSGILHAQMADKFSSLDKVKSERKSITGSLKAFFTTRFLSIGQTIRRQFIPFRQHDHEISARAEVERKVELVPFTQDMRNELDNLFRSPNQMICTAFSINIHTKDLITLLGSNWLNDSVIEFYLNLIALRSQSPNYPSVYTFGTFFFTRLCKGSGLGRWANKLDFFSYDILIVPIHSACHWRLAIVDNVDKRIAYYDSLGGEYRQCVDLLAEFLQKESMDKKKEKLDMSEWERNYSIPNIPLQNNSYDCGVFTCKYADYLARRRPITFTQENIPYFRDCMIYEIIHKKLLN